MKNKQSSYMEDYAQKGERQCGLKIKSIVQINKNLFQKHCQSQNYFYSRDINEILRDASSKAVIRFKDWVGYDDNEEYLKRFYYGNEYPKKIQLLTEYYKFHTDIARIFMEPVAMQLNKYYDKKRKYEYYRIAHLIDEENKKNPNQPPKGIVGERPSPANSQESLKEKESKIAFRNIQILKDLSWINKSTQQSQKKNDNSCTLQEICKQLGHFGLEQSSLIITSGKDDEVILDQFLTHLNQQILQTHRDNESLQIQKQIKQLSNPHQQLIQSVIQKYHDDNKQRFGSLHSKNQIELVQQNNILQRDTNINFIKKQVNSILKNKQRNLNLKSQIKMDQHEKQETNSKSKTIVQYQPKISTQYFIKDLNSNFQSIPQILNNHNQNQIVPAISYNNNQQTQKIKQKSNGQLNLKQISKIFFEENSTEQELRWKNGSQTHRPISGTKNFFSNRNSPNGSKGIQYEQLNKQFIQTSRQGSTYSQISQQQSQKSIKVAGPSTFRKPAQPNIHIQYTSNQDKIININININDDLQNQKLKLSKHKKNQSEGKPIPLNAPLIENKQKNVCLTDRACQGEFLFKNSIAASCQNSPKTQKLNRISKGQTDLKQLGSTKNSIIQSIITQVSKQQQRQDIISQQLRKPN